MVVIDTLDPIDGAALAGALAAAPFFGILLLQRKETGVTNTTREESWVAIRLLHLSQNYMYRLRFRLEENTIYILRVDPPLLQNRVAAFGPSHPPASVPWSYKLLVYCVVSFKHGALIYISGMPYPAKEHMLLHIVLKYLNFVFRRFGIM